jgi:hypothetical protein
MQVLGDRGTLLEDLLIAAVAAPQHERFLSNPAAGSHQLQDMTSK